MITLPQDVLHTIIQLLPFSSLLIFRLLNRQAETAIRQNCKRLRHQRAERLVLSHIDAFKIFRIDKLRSNQKRSYFALHSPKGVKVNFVTSGKASDAEIQILRGDLNDLKWVLSLMPFHLYHFKALSVELHEKELKEIAHYLPRDVGSLKIDRPISSDCLYKIISNLSHLHDLSVYNLTEGSSLADRRLFEDECIQNLRTITLNSFARLSALSLDDSLFSMQKWKKASLNALTKVTSWV